MTSVFLPVFILVAATASGPDAHVSFIVMGKTTNHRQSAGAGDELALLNYHFFAEVFVRPGSRVTNASLGFPNGEIQPFEDLGYVLELHGGRYDDEAELDRLYPNGPYTFRFATPDGNVDGRVLRMRGTGEGDSRIPSPPTIVLHQDGHTVSPAEVDPELDLVVTWSDFDSGRADENGILDDLLFVVLGNCHGEKLVHSGRPFEGTAHLDFRSERYTIPEAKLRPGQPHQMFVEHATVDTSREDGIVGLVTYAATTFLDFETTGVSEGPACPAVMPKIDQGQTDRSP